MFTKTPPKKIFMVVVLIGLVIFPVQRILTMSVGTLYASTLPGVKNEIVFQGQNQLRTGLPAYLKIPSIKVDVFIEDVGLTEDGTMDVPKNPENVAWYKSGQRPGEIGTAVIAGHYGWKEGKKVAFDNLEKLRKGDVIRVEDNTGGIISFVVREIKSYDPNDEVSDVFTSHDSLAHLNLITCQGVWDKTTQSYSRRLVIFTDMEQTL